MEKNLIEVKGNGCTVIIQNRNDGYVQKTTPSNYVERVAILCFHYSVKSITQVRYISNTTYKM